MMRIRPPLPLLSTLRRILLGSTGLALMACAELPREGRLIADPHEDLNRQVHALNKSLDTAVLKPASQAYAAVTPDLVRFLISNGVSNLELPVDATNYLLQGRFMDALATTGRFGMNTVFGAGGLLDPATAFGLSWRKTDFGETLYVWGVPEGAYVELPFFGPSTRRDAFGRAVDYLIDPTTYLGFVPLEPALRNSVMAADVAELLNQRAENAGRIDPLLYQSSDSYTELKNSYVQFRRRQLGQEQSTDAALPDIFDDPADE